MTKSKKLLSVFLAVVMVLSTFTVGFYAIAADEGETADSAVTDVETKIAAFYENRTYLFSTSNAEKREQAVKDYDAAVAALKALSEDQKLELSAPYYGFILYYVTQSVAREVLPDESYYSTAQYVDVTMNHLDAIEEAAGALPQSYQEVYDVYKTFFSVGNFESSSFSWKDNAEAQAAFETWAKAVIGFDAKQFEFSNYLSAASSGDGGFYFYQMNLDATSRTTGYLIKYAYNNVQDNETEAGKNPSSVSYSTFISYSYSSKTAEWKADQNGATMLKAYQDYYALVQSDQVAVSEQTSDMLLEMLESKYAGITSAVQDVISVGQTLIEDADSADLDEIKAAVEAYNNLSADTKSMADSIMSSATLKFAATLSVPIVYDENTDALEAYNNRPAVSTYKGSDLLSQATAYINEAQLNDFIAYIDGLDLDALTDEIITEAKSKYAQLSADSKGTIPEETYSKFVQIVTPIKDTNDFSDEIAAFQPTDFVRPTNSKVAWTEGGIQSFVDKLGGLVGGFVNINDILSQNLYTADIVNMIFDLYATLSHNTTDIEGLITLGEIISGVITPEYLTSSLPESKFSAVVEKINAAEVAEGDPEGTNILDKIAAIDFTAEDWGFTSGDKDGFVDALLAALRPITQLLDPEAQISFKALGFLTITANIGLRMFDPQITDDGNYAASIYENLLPLLEQLGMNDLPTTEEYKANYYAVKEESGAAVAADEFLKPILDSLFANVVDPIAADPLNGLIKILPRLAYVVDGDRLNTYIQKVLSDQGKIVSLEGLAASFAGEGPLLDLTTLGLDLSTEAINNLIPDSIDIGSLVGDGTELVLNIGDLPWTTLANCATLSAVPSSTITNAYTLLRTGEADSCISTVMYFLYDVALADTDTYNAIKTLVKGVVPDNLASLIDSVFAVALDPAQAAGDKYTGYGLILDNGLIGGVPTGNEIWRVNAAAGAGGTISPSGDIAVKQADSRTFTITADAGHTISSLTVNGQAVAAAAGKTAYDYTVNGADVTSADAANQNTTDVTIAVTFADESGKPGPGPDDPSDPTDPTDPSNPTDPSGNNNQGGNNGGSTNNGGKLPTVNNGNPNLPNTGAQEIAGMSVLTVILAVAAGAIVWLVLRKRIVKE